MLMFQVTPIPLMGWKNTQNTVSEWWPTINMVLGSPHKMSLFRHCQMVSLSSFGTTYCAWGPWWLSSEVTGFDVKKILFKSQKPFFVVWLWSSHLTCLSHLASFFNVKMWIILSALGCRKDFVRDHRTRHCQIPNSFWVLFSVGAFV